MQYNNLKTKLPLEKKFFNFNDYHNYWTKIHNNFSEYSIGISYYYEIIVNHADHKHDVNKKIFNSDYNGTGYNYFYRLGHNIGDIMICAKCNEYNKVINYYILWKIYNKVINYYILWKISKYNTETLINYNNKSINIFLNGFNDGSHNVYYNKSRYWYLLMPIIEIIYIFINECN